MDDHDLLVKKSFLVVPMDYAAVILLLPVEDADGKVIIVAYTYAILYLVLSCLSLSLKMSTVKLYSSK